MSFIKNKSKGFSDIKCFLVSLLVASAFFVTLKTPEPYESNISRGAINGIFKLFEHINSTFDGYGFVITVLAAVFTYLFYRLLGEKKGFLTPAKGDRAMAAFFSVMYTGGRAFAYSDSLSALWSPKFNLIKALIIFGGFYYLYLLLILVFAHLLDNRNSIRFDIWKRVPAFAQKAYEKRPFLFLWGCIFGVWLIHLILRFPAAMSTDNWRQLNYFYGQETFTKAQPVFHTFITGVFVDTSIKLFGGGNVGIFLYVLCQALMMSAALAYTMIFLKKWGTPAWFKAVVMFIYCVTPYFTGNAAWAIKDYPHMIGFVVWCLCLIDMILAKKTDISVKKDWKVLLMWTLSAVFMSLFRKNGLYIYFITVVILLAVLVANIIKNKKKFCVWVLVFAILPVILSSALEKYVVVKYNVQNDTIKEALSLPFQQTARYVRDYGDEVTDEEREVISQVLKYDDLATDYTTWCSDDVKSEFHAKDTSQVLDYLRVWFLMFFKHPMCYVEATWNQNYFMFMPDFDNVVYNQDCDNGKGVAEADFLEFVGIHVPEAMQGIPIAICSFYRMLNRLPVISCLNNLGIYVMMLFTIALFMRRKKLRYYKLTLIPLWLSLLFVILAPMIKNQPRYSWGIIYMMPTVIAMYMYLLGKEDRNAD